MPVTFKRSTYADDNMIILYKTSGDLYFLDKNKNFPQPFPQPKQGMNILKTDGLKGQEQQSN